VTTHAITVHCHKDHQGFMAPFLSRYFEDAATKGHFIAHSMRNGQDPLHLKAYHNAIVLQNQLLSNVRMPTLEPERDRFGRIIQVQELSDEWLSGTEIRIRQESCRNRQNRRNRQIEEELCRQREPQQQRELQPLVPPAPNYESEEGTNSNNTEFKPADQELNEEAKSKDRSGTD
jgi:hypothetical protein